MMTAPLHPDHFDGFHAAVHGYAPFDWQNELLRQVIRERRWPRVLDIPTGAGKTTCIDIALFALALDAQRPPAERWCPRRIAMVVDRRIVVDQAAERGRKLLHALEHVQAESVRQVAQLLRSLNGDVAPDQAPIGVFTLRGGMPKDDGWTRSPVQPLVIASTVDQLGSRLLMQGYGVSNSMKPVHAGLAANDILILLDEVHLSRAFAQTLEALERLRSRAARQTSIDSRFHFAFLSATPGQALQAFRLDPGGIAPTSTLGRRLHASKPASLLEKPSNQVTQSCVDHALELAQQHKCVAVVVNRVAKAIDIADRLKQKTSTRVEVLTGRMRPLDRDALENRLRPLVITGRNREDQEPIIVVATQCIEAGADFDFDALVTEAASLPALRQRFGRLDRLGEYGKSEAVIVRDKELKNDPIYGNTIDACWQWLKEQAARTKTVDFGITHFPMPPADRIAAMSESTPEDEEAPVLLPAYLDLWVQTSPVPTAMPDVALWLHGARAAPAEVQVIWRRDLNNELLARARSPDSKIARRTLRQLIAVVSAVRPSSLEAISLPIEAARRWLRHDVPSEIADVERAADTDYDGEQRGGLALCWNGDDSEVIDASELRPGDTIIVAATRGGIRNYNFDPTSRDLVSDVAEQAALLARGLPVLRLHDRILDHHQLPRSYDADEMIEYLQNLDTAGLEGWKTVWVQALGTGPRAKRILVEAGDDTWTVIQGRPVSAGELRTVLQSGDTIEEGAELGTDDEDSPHSGTRQSLSKHTSLVVRFARAFATAAGLPTVIAEDISLAAWLHDIGKADPRFQILLHGGDEVSYYAANELLAKSGMARGDRGAQRLAQRRSGYPQRARHELQSVSLIEADPELLRTKAHDPELVLHLIASHHGHARPFAPVVDDSMPVAVAIAEHRSEAFGSLSVQVPTSRHDLHRFNSPLAERFWGVVKKYGWLELCWLESMLRLADHLASELGESDREVS